MLLFLSLLVVSSSQGTEVCFEGFVMDNYCIYRGTLLDNPSLTSLMNPDKHTFHCIADPPACYNSGFQLLADPLAGSQTYCRAYSLDAAGNRKALELARATGSKNGCSTCSNIS